MALKFLNAGPENTGAFAIISELLKKLFNRTTAIFTAISIVLCTFESATGAASMRASLFWYFLLFSAILSVISTITDYMKFKKLHYIVVMITHFVLSYIAFFFIFINGNLFNAYMTDAGNTKDSPFFVGFIYTFAFIGAYIIVFGIKFAYMILADKLKNKFLSHKSKGTSDENEK